MSDDLGGRARLGVALLAARTAIVQVGVLVGQIVMARLLEPADFGLYGACVVAMQFFAFFGDGGLAAALIQKREAPTDRELSSAFWLMVGVALVVVALAWALAPWLSVVWPDAPPRGATLLRIVAFEFLLVSLRAIPTLLLERDVSYARLAVVETVRDLSYYFVALPLAAFTTLGVLSIGVGILAEGTLGVLLAFWARPFRPRWVFDRAALGPLLRYGLQFQGSRFINLVNEGVLPILGGRLGLASVGLLRWARETSSFPMKLVEILARVTFPVYGRVRNEPEKMAETLSRATFLCALLGAALSGMFLGMGRPFVRVVWSEKWLAAEPAFHVYLAAAVLPILGPLVSSACDALGKPKVFVRVALSLLALNWTLLLIVRPANIRDFALAHVAHAVVGFVVAALIARALVPGVALARSLATPILGGGVAFAAGTQLAPHVHGPLTLVPAVLICLVSATLPALLLDRARVRTALQIA